MGIGDADIRVTTRKKNIAHIQKKKKTTKIEQHIVNECDSGASGVGYGKALKIASTDTFRFYIGQVNG